jgi:glycerol-3-phosphate dehydrogenase (NAD+)
MDELEQELLNGQKLQGATTAQEVNTFLKSRGKSHEFPLFRAVHEIVYEGRDASTLVEVGNQR